MNLKKKCKTTSHKERHKRCRLTCLYHSSSSHSSSSSESSSHSSSSSNIRANTSFTVSVLVKQASATLRLVIRHLSRKRTMPSHCDGFSIGFLSQSSRSKTPSAHVCLYSYKSSTCSENYAPRQPDHAHQSRSIP
jgi:hypothetical protein